MNSTYISNSLASVGDAVDRLTGKVGALLELQCANADYLERIAVALERIAAGECAHGEA